MTLTAPWQALQILAAFLLLQMTPHPALLQDVQKQVQRVKEQSGFGAQRLLVNST